MTQMNTFHPKGLALLDDPIRNQGTAFTREDRAKYGLEGLLPDAVETIDRQMDRVLSHLKSKSDDIERYIYLIGLAERNQTLFYKTVMSDPARFVPILYDPTIADACLRYGHIYRRPAGMYLSRAMKGRFAEILANWPEKDIRFICVSSGGRILGLGDIGVNGAPIPLGKLQLYTACAAVPPAALLPILLDIGTTNAPNRADPLYLGLRQEPPDPDEVDAIMDEFMAAAQQTFPGCCVHFEDWKGTDAIRLLARYQDKMLCYNDDIQGTASVTLAGLITALQITDTKLTDQRIFFLGAGSAAIGIANMIVEAMAEEGLTKQEAQKRITLFDVEGLIQPARKDLSDSQKIYAHKAAPETDLKSAIETFKPTILIGVSTTGGAFTEAVIKTMAKHTPRPIIFPLSNPTDKAECTPQQAYQWTNGKALVACGVQFPDVTIDGQTFHPGQANNFYIFPAIGLAVYATRPKLITDHMFIQAARATADQVTQEDRAHGMLFPAQSNILETEITTAARVAEFIFDQSQATVPRPPDIRAWLESLTYKPEYKR